MNILRRLIQKLRMSIGGRTSAQRELEHLKRRGLRIGENVDILSDYPFDSLYPGLISIGDHVTISSNVKILAHDASMGYLNDGPVKSELSKLATMYSLVKVPRSCAMSGSEITQLSVQEVLLPAMYLHTRYMRETLPALSRQRNSFGSSMKAT